MEHEAHIFTFWGKADRSNEEELRYHPAICHMIDVGVVAEELMKKTRFKLESFDTGTLAFICALHDIGKVSPGFQWKHNVFTKILEENGYKAQLGAEKDHGRVVAKYLPDMLKKYCPNEVLRYLLALVLSAHHGTFPNSVDGIIEKFDGAEKWASARNDVMEALASLFKPSFENNTPLPLLTESIRLAGFLTVADWLASNENYFPYTASLNDNFQNFRLDDYIKERRSKAKKVLDGLHMGSTLKSKKAFSDMFSFSHNECQEAVASIAQELKHPMLIVVETPMGSGKTEAALEAYSYIAIKNPLRGMYYALPTQATSNAMFGRILSFIEKLDLSAKTEFHLLHANAGINEQYKELRASNIEDDTHGADGGVYASSWFIENKKRGLLADFNVGTVDQALMSVLKNRFFFVRSFGLSSKVVVLDEVHAYDAYMTEEISCLVEWLLKQNTSVILLSATLPEDKRRKIVGGVVKTIPEGVKYPCVIGADTSGRLLHKSLSLDGMEQADIIMKPEVFSGGGEEKAALIRRLLEERLKEGGCAACILNTVSDAQSLYKELRTAGTFNDIILFHGRFTVDRKEQIEKYVLSRYGKQKGKAPFMRPHKGVVVATQVLEQSLDVDFDIMISDIAPIDILLQRAGRLHRHDNSRPQHLHERTLYVLIPDMNREKPDFGGSQFVYFPAILTNTASLFFKGDNTYQAIKVGIPGDVSEIVERVYNPKMEEEGAPSLFKFNDTLEKWLSDRDGKEMSQDYIGKANTLGDPDEDVFECLLNIDNKWDEDIPRPSRLMKPSVQLVVVREGQSLDAFNNKNERSLFGQSVVTSNKAVVKHFLSSKDGPPDWWKRSPILRTSWPLMLCGGVCEVDIGDVTVSYNDEYGLRVVKKQKNRKKGGIDG